MKEYIKRLPRDIQELISLASKISAEKGVSAYLVGGFVRDLLLGRPNLDLDIVVEGDGIEFAGELARRLGARWVRHRRFGTANVTTPRKVKIDVSTARQEFYEAPGSLPCVNPGMLEDDLRRRDFTINAMAISINAQDFGRLIDVVKGQVDLRYKKIRILHDLSFLDDPTRILRAVRFEQRYDFHIEPHTSRVLKCALEADMLRKVSPHRIRDEIILILKEPRVLFCVRRLAHLTGFDFIHPGLKVGSRTLGLLKAVRSQIAWYKKNLSRRRALDEWLMYFIIILDPLSVRQIAQLSRKFALTRGEEKRMIFFRKESSALKRALSRQALKPSVVFKALEPLSYEVIILAKARYKDRLLSGYIGRFLKSYNGIRNLISGTDLARIGIEPGPSYKKILDELLYLRLDGHLRTRSAQIGWIKDKIKRK